MLNMVHLVIFIKGLNKTAITTYTLVILVIDIEDILFDFNMLWQPDLADEALFIDDI